MSELKVGDLLSNPQKGITFCTGENDGTFILLAQDQDSGTFVVDGYKCIKRMYNGKPPPRDGPRNPNEVCVVLSTRQTSRTHYILIGWRKWVVTQVEVKIV